MDSVYIHIPFCRNICSYCDFCKMLYNGGFVTKYLNALVREIKDFYNNEEVNTLYVGGGTPSCLQKKDLNYFFEILKIINKSKNCEFTFECNLNDIDEDLLTILSDNGVNRLSIGIESFDSDKLIFMEREHTIEEAKSKIKLCRQYGFDNINVDLIYAVPNETLKILKKDLDQFLELDVEHISTYSLIIEDNTKCHYLNIEEINEDLDASMYALINKKLSKKYERYEISNFSKKGYESKHNLKYWNNEEYYGFGLGASGYIDGVRYENTRSLTKYCEDQFKKDRSILSKQDMMDNEIMLGLRKTKGIDVVEFFNKYEENIQNIYEIKPLLKSKDLIYRKGHLFVNPKKTYVMNEILLKLL